VGERESYIRKDSMITPWKEVDLHRSVGLNTREKEGLKRELRLDGRGGGVSVGHKTGVNRDSKVYISSL